MPSNTKRRKDKIPVHTPYWWREDNLMSFSTWFWSFNWITDALGRVSGSHSHSLKNCCSSWHQILFFLEYLIWWRSQCFLHIWFFHFLRQESVSSNPFKDKSNSEQRLTTNLSNKSAIEGGGSCSFTTTASRCQQLTVWRVLVGNPEHFKSISEILLLM